MTETQYLSDPYQKKATSKVTEVGDTYLILDQTIFYPQGGGQPADKGTISSGKATLKVKSIEYNGGEIKHIGTIQGKFSIKDKVTLTIDWDLRLKHMHWHTAGHLVDLVTRQLYPKLIPIHGIHGIGKKLFIEYEGIHKLDIIQLNATLSKLLSSTPNIQTKFVTLDELKSMANWIPAHLPAGKKLRVLSIGDTYHIPDGGTQLKTSEEIWPITFSQIEHTINSTLVHYVVDQPKTQLINHSNHQYTTIDMKSSIENLQQTFSSGLEIIKSPSELQALDHKYLGKKGQINLLMKSLQGLTLKDKQKFGPILNDLKKSQESQIKEKAKALESKSWSLNSIDLTIPGKVKSIGHLHPTTIIIRELNDFFRYHGFSIGEGPEIETVEYNFRRLNLPEGHPATDLQDTLFVKEPDILLRTHTSSVEARILSSNKPPLRVVVPGKVYRNETTNKTNGSFFHHYQGLVVDKGINIGHLKHILTLVHQYLFGEDVILRYRYKYYPEVSPGMGIDMQCKFCRGLGCDVCKQRGWIESLGSGMIHYNTLKVSGIDPNIYTGFAFGMGLDRLVMSKFGIPDIRKLYGGELVYT